MQSRPLGKTYSVPQKWKGRGAEMRWKVNRTIGNAIKEFKKTDNPLFVQEVFTRVKNYLLEVGEAFPDECILENANRVINLKSNKDKTDDELI